MHQRGCGQPWPPHCLLCVRLEAQVTRMAPSALPWLPLGSHLGLSTQRHSGNSPPARPHYHPLIQILWFTVRKLTQRTATMGTRAFVTLTFHSPIWKQDLRGKYERFLEDALYELHECRMVANTPGNNPQETLEEEKHTLQGHISSAWDEGRRWHSNQQGSLQEEVCGLQILQALCPPRQNLTDAHSSSKQTPHTSTRPSEDKDPSPPNHIPHMGWLSPSTR